MTTPEISLSVTRMNLHPVDAFDLSPYHFSLTPTGLITNAEPTFQQWQECGFMLRVWFSQLLSRATQIQFAIGDWLIYGEQHYGEMYAQALSETDYDYGTLRNFKYVANNVPLSLRHDNLTFEHHRAVAPLESDQQAGWLDRAERDNLSAKQLAEHVGASRGRMPKSQTVTCPSCGVIFEV